MLPPFFSSMSLASALKQATIVLPEAGKPQRVDSVVVDGLALLKIVKHARENPFDNVSGPLLGPRPPRRRREGPHIAAHPGARA